MGICCDNLKPEESYSQSNLKVPIVLLEVIRR